MKRKWPKFILVSVLLGSLAPIVGRTQETKTSTTITYPFHASGERSKQIIENYRTIEIGMSVDQVNTIIGPPDENLPLFEPKIFKPLQIGRTHWYLLQRLTETGSANDKAEKLVRISYDTNWKVIRVDHRGFDEKNR